MYIKKATIFGFGNLVEQTFTFDPSLTVIYGLNETGKSTLLNFIMSMLFGFATKKRPYEQYIPKDTGRYGGELTLDVSGQTLLIRRTGGENGNTLEVFLDQTQIDNEQLTQLLHPLDKDLFKTLFYIDTNSMMQVTSLDQEALMTQILAIGAVNSGDWLKRADAYETAAKKLYKPSGRKPPINQKLETYHQLQGKITKARESLPKYLSLQQENDRLNQQLNETITSQQTQEHGVKTLAHLQEIWPTYAQYLKLTQDNLETKDTTDVEQLYQQYQEIQTKIDLQTDFIEKRRSESQAALPEQTIYQKYDAQFQEIRQQLPHVQSLIGRRATLQKRIQENENQVQRLQADNAQVTEDMQPLSSSDLSLISQYRTQLKTQQDLKAQLQQNDAELQLQENQQARAIAQMDPAQGDSPAENLTFLNVLMLFGGLIFVVGLFLPSFVKIIALAGAGMVALSVYQKRLVHGRTAQAQTATDRSAQKAQTAKLKQIQARRHETGENLQAVEAKITDLQDKMTIINAKYNLAPDFDPLQMQPLLTTITQLGEDADKQSQELADLQEALKVFDNLTEFLKDQLAAYPVFSQDYFKALNQEIEAYDRASSENAQVQVAQEQLKGWLKQQKADLAELKWQQEQLLQANHFENFAELQGTLQNQQKLKNNQERLEFLKQQLHQDLAQLQKYSSESNLQADLAEKRQAMTEITEQANHLSAQANDIAVDLAQLASSDQLQILQQESANLEADLTADISEYLLDSLTAQWIHTTLASASQTRLPKILKNAQTYFNVLTQEKYEAIIFRDNQLFAQTKDRHEFNVNELSLGTMEQLYLALRLAFTVELSDLVAVPILLDDVLINADDQRAAEMIALVGHVSQKAQVIFTTAHAHFADALKDAKMIEL